jgi:hypothetical protein
MSMHEFNCPACRQPIRLGGEDLIEGNEVFCGHCGEQFVASREFDEDGGGMHWSLIQRELDLED